MNMPEYPLIIVINITEASGHIMLIGLSYYVNVCCIIIAIYRYKRLLTKYTIRRCQDQKFELLYYIILLNDYNYISLDLVKNTYVAFYC